MYIRGTAEQWGVYQTPGESVEHPDTTLRTLSLDRMLRAVDAAWDAAALSRST